MVSVLRAFCCIGCCPTVRARPQLETCLWNTGLVLTRGDWGHWLLSNIGIGGVTWTGHGVLSLLGPLLRVLKMFSNRHFYVSRHTLARRKDPSYLSNQQGDGRWQKMTQRLSLAVSERLVILLHPCPAYNSRYNMCLKFNILNWSFVCWYSRRFWRNRSFATLWAYESCQTLAIEIWRLKQHHTNNQKNLNHF